MKKRIGILAIWVSLIELIELRFGIRIRARVWVTARGSERVRVRVRVWERVGSFFPLEEPIIIIFRNRNRLGIGVG